MTIYDHHEENGQISANNFLKYIEKVGFYSTIICELLQQKFIRLNSVEATAMALGIHVDTSPLIFEQTPPRILNIFFAHYGSIVNPLEINETINVK